MRHKGEKREPELRTNAGHDVLPRPQHLGAYAPLVAAMREELEQFVASHVRMHLAIAEHDRYLLTSIEVECVAGDEPRELLQRFIREFKPRQIKALSREGGDRPVAERERDRPRAFRRAQRRGGRRQRGGGRRSVWRIAGGAPKLRAAYGVPSVPGDPERALVGAGPAGCRREGRGSRLRCSAHAARRSNAGSGNRRRQRQSPCHPAVRRSGPSLYRGQRRRRRHHGQRQVCQPAALRDLARQGRVVGHRQRVDQWHPRRIREQCAWTQRRQFRQFRRADGDRSGDRRTHRPVRACAGRAVAIPAASAAHRGRARGPRYADGAAGRKRPRHP